MAVPKKRTSKSRRGMRRAHWKLAVPAFQYCPDCGEVMQPHHVCSSCGYYKGKKVIEVAKE